MGRRPEFESSYREDGLLAMGSVTQKKDYKAQPQ